MPSVGSPAVSVTPRPRVLVVTSHFPLRRRGDVTGNFVVDPLLAVADEVDIEVLAPLDQAVAARRERFAGRLEVHRVQYCWPRRAQRLAYGFGIPTNLRRSPVAWLQLPLFASAMATAIWRRARHADVIHAHWLPMAALAWPARLRWRVPVVVTLHGTDVTQFPRWWVRLLLRTVDEAVSSHEDLLRTVAELAPTLPRSRIRHLVEPQPVDEVLAAELAARFGTSPVVLFVARLSPERDPVTFVRAAPHVLTAVPDAQFAVVGDGPLRSVVAAEAARLGVRDRVHLFGHQAEVWTFLRAAHVFCALSDRNNIWVTAVVEAMRAGVPVVATTAGDTARVLRDGHDALLVPVGDPEAVARAVVRLLTDPALARRVADAARATLDAHGFDPGLVRAQTVDLYRRWAQR